MKAIIEKYGWKTILGTLIIAAGQIMHVIPDLEPYAPYADALGLALGGIGIRIAIAKTEKTNA